MKNFFWLLFVIFPFRFCMGINPAIEAKIDSILSLMTLEEKAGQMNQYSNFWDVTGPVPEDANAQQKIEHLRSGRVGSVLNVRGAEQVRKMQELVVNNTRLGIPLIFGIDVIHGYKTQSPIPLAESASWDLEAIEKSARIAATEAAANGINWTFAPMVDISRDARWGRVMEGGGEDPFLGSKIAAARVRGFQGEDLSAKNTIAATAKHFAAYGFTEAGRDYNTVDIGTVTLYNIVLPPFKAAVDAGVRTLMNSFNVLNGVPTTGSSYLQRDILKGAWKFDGFVVSDWASGREMMDHGFAENLKQTAEQAVLAGSDMDMESYAYVNHIKEVVEEGRVDVQVVDDAVRRILRVKFELGLFKDPYLYCDAAREKELTSHPDHLEAALDMAKKSIVLLKNDNQTLPFDKNQKKIALIGALAAEKDSPLGSWRCAAENGSAVSVLEGIDKYTSGFKYAKGADLVLGETSFTREVQINTSDKSEFDKAVKLASESEVVLMVLGEHCFQSAEGRSRTRLGLPGVQQELLEAVYAVNQNIVLVLMNGRPLVLTWAQNHLPAIVEAWHPGSRSGDAIAQVLFGDYNPSGKLPMTFPRSVGQVPIYYNHYNTGKPDAQENVFWSHYIDESNAPLYPFGFGLSYTDFSYSGLKIDVNDNRNVNIQITVKNIGDIAGEEVVQLHIRDKVASVVRPVKELKGFEKIHLKPGEAKEITFTLTEKELGFYNQTGQFVVEPGVFDVLVGTNSQEGVTGRFEIGL